MASAFADDPYARVPRFLPGAALVGLLLGQTACTSEEKAAGLRIDAGRDATTIDANAEDATPRTSVTPAAEGEPYATLAEWHLFADPRRQTPAPRVIPYEVISQLFADYAVKFRFLYVPEGARIGYSRTEKWNLPVGTILVKTFAYAQLGGAEPRLLETRLLIHESSGWSPHTYVWNAEQTAATLELGGAVIDSAFVDTAQGARTNAYVVPSENDCRACHGRLGETDTLGARTRQLDRDNDYGAGPQNQLDHLTALGLFDSAPEPYPERVHLVDPGGTSPVFERARSYFDGNCSHCHRPGNAQASSTGYWLDYDSTDPALSPKANWGFCKQPTAAGGANCGHQFDVVPGKPDDSILVCRLESTRPKERMPPLGRNLAHAEGAALVREWIESIEGQCGRTTPDASRDASSAPPRDAARDGGDSG